MIKFPYGIADFLRIRRDGMVYVDRTAHIRDVESLGDILVFLRPRRFGKSLWLRTLATYYDLRYAGDFDRIFGGLGQSGNHPRQSDQRRPPDALQALPPDRRVRQLRGRGDGPGRRDLSRPLRRRRTVQGADEDGQRLDRRPGARTGIRHRRLARRSTNSAAMASRRAATLSSPSAWNGSWVKKSWVASATSGDVA